MALLVVPKLRLVTDCLDSTPGRVLSDISALAGVALLVFSPIPLTFPEGPDILLVLLRKLDGDKWFGPFLSPSVGKASGSTMQVPG